MKRPGRPLAPDEAALWRRVTETVRPLPGTRVSSRHAATRGDAVVERQVQHAPAIPPPPPAGPALRSREERRVPDRQTLDASWDRKLARGSLPPDFTIDLHDASLNAAYMRLEHGLAQAVAQGARVVLLITGRARPSDDHAGRSTRRGAIRAMFLDWLMAGPHASRIAALRPAHPRHGGAGAVYLILRRAR